MFTVDLTNKHVVMDRDYVDSYRNRTGPHQNGMWMQYNESKVRSSAGLPAWRLVKMRKIWQMHVVQQCMWRATLLT